MANNIRNAGRKRALTTEQINDIKKRRDAGASLNSIAKEFGVSRQTLSAYMNDNHINKIRKYYTEYVRWAKANRDFINVDLNLYTMRMDYMNEQEICTSILINLSGKMIKIKNETDDIFHRAFGVIMNPDWNDFEDFLEYRVFSEARGDKKCLLKSLDLDHYDRLSIIEKTEGRLVDDKQWIRIIYYDKCEITK